MVLVWFWYFGILFFEAVSYTSDWSQKSLPKQGWFSTSDLPACFASAKITGMCIRACLCSAGVKSRASCVRHSVQLLEGGEDFMKISNSKLQGPSDHRSFLHSGSRRGKTGRIRFPNAESWVMKYPDECAWACCRAAFCWAAMCCCSAWSRKSLLREGLEREMLAPGWLAEDWFCISNFLFSLSSSAKIATLFLFWKPGCEESRKTSLSGHGCAGAG